MKNDPARRRLARIRCLLDSVKCLQNGKNLPTSLCFVPAELEYATVGEGSGIIPIYQSPSKDSEKVGAIPQNPGVNVFASGEEFTNDHGDWIKLTQKTLHLYSAVDSTECGWVLYDPLPAKGVEKSRPVLVHVEKNDKTTKSAIKTEDNTITRWQEAVESAYCIGGFKMSSLDKVSDKEAVKALRTPPPNWSLEADQELAQFLKEHINKQEIALGSISRFVEEVKVSSEEDTVEMLSDGDPDSYWESDGAQGRHWIRLKMKPGVIIKHMYVTVDASDDNYMPSNIVVEGGERAGNVVRLNEVFIDKNTSGDVLILQDMSEYHQIIKIRIKACKDDGIDCRIHGIKIVPSKERVSAINKNLFSKDLVRFTKLENVEPELLYRRSLALIRFISLLDSVIHFVLPAWNYTAGSFNTLESVRDLMPLSRNRNTLIEKFLKESQTCSVPNKTPKLWLNRHSASEHKSNPSKDPEAKSSLFSQIYEGLKPEKCGTKVDFRWSARHEQWWECKFIGEGIIDQGGGFRDSLADVAEELCPSSSEETLPLNFFVRSPNQVHDSASVHKDAYVPRPSCHQMNRYEWIGKLMGGCFRGKEHLVLMLPSFTWKQLLGQKVTWKDFITVDAAQVRLADSLEHMDKPTFDSKYGGILTYTAVLSDNTVVNLVPDGADKYVEYEHRHKYIQLLKKCRMNEGAKQVEVLRRGLLKVVPQALLDLLTWKELEKRICGDPEITIEALKKSTQYEDLSVNGKSVKFFWQAMEGFSDEERSRFLRFVTGRRRLPAPLFISRWEGDCGKDCLPQASTCSGTLYLPEYSSVKVAEEKLKYAAYNCIAIDTDMSQWEE